jgi:thymidylate synthase (FAD)
MGVVMSADTTYTNILGDGNKSWVELQSVMPETNHGYDADRAVVQAARVSFMEETRGLEADRKLLLYLWNNRHTTPFEQVVFKFRVKAPVVVWWQWVRHRTWSYNFQSGRYTAFQEDDFYIPAEWRLQSKDNKQGSSGTVDPADNRLLDKRMQQTARDGFYNYQLALDMGVAKEQARFFLPAWCSYYTAVCTVDAWNLLHFIGLRMELHAQWEIRQYAKILFRVVQDTMPWTAEAFLATCTNLDLD